MLSAWIIVFSLSSSTKKSSERYRWNVHHQDLVFLDGVVPRRLSTFDLGRKTFRESIERSTTPSRRQQLNNYGEYDRLYTLFYMGAWHKHPKYPGVELCRIQTTLILVNQGALTSTGINCRSSRSWHFVKFSQLPNISSPIKSHPVKSPLVNLKFAWKLEHRQPLLLALLTGSLGK